RQLGSFHLRGSRPVQRRFQDRSHRNAGADRRTDRGFEVGRGRSGLDGFPPLPGRSRVFRQTGNTLGTATGSRNTRQSCRLMPAAGSTMHEPVPIQELFGKAERLAAAFAETAVERDKAGGTAKAERDRLRESGLLNLIIPTEYGGYGL